MLTGEQHQIDTTIAHACLLLAACGATEPSDRLVRRWQLVTQRSAADLAAEPVRARAWAMLLANRAGTPRWAAELTPLDLDEAQEQHERYLHRGVAALPEGFAAGGTASRIVSGIAELAQGHSEPDALRTLAAEADSLAARGSLAAADTAVGRWAGRAKGTARPEVAMLAACRSLAPLLLDGMLAPHLGIPTDWGSRCAGELTAALGTRTSSADEQGSWRELLTTIMRLRTAEDSPELPAPAEPREINEAEARLGTRLPDDYRQFLLTSDGLAADVVFPRLLGAGELVRTAEGVPVSATATQYGESLAVVLVARDDGWHPVEWDSTLGTTEYTDFRALLHQHLRLLEDG